MPTNDKKYANGMLIERKISDLSDGEYKLFTSYTETRALLGLGRLGARE
jgi:hypothetical protein